MKKNNYYDEIRGFGIFSTLFLSLVGFGVFTYSQKMGELLGTSGILITLVYGFLYLFFIWLIYKTIKLNQNKKFEEIVFSLCGKFIGNILLFLISFCIIFLISMELRIFIDSIKSYILPNVNEEFMIILTLLVCYYVAKEGERAMCGLNEVMFVFLMLSCIFILVIVFKNIDLTNILPFKIKNTKDYFSGFLRFGGYFSGSLILYYLIPMYKSERDNTPHVIYKSSIFSFLFLSLMFLICVSVLNINQTVNSSWPVILTFTTVDVFGGFIERVEGVIIAISIVFFIINFINLYFYAGYINSKSLGVKHKLSSIMFIPIVYVLTLIPKTSFGLILNKLSFILSIFIAFCIPFLLFGLTIIKKIFNGEVKDETNNS